MIFPMRGDGVGFNHQAVSVCRGQPDIGFGVEFIPAFQPGGHCVFLSAADIQHFVFLLGGGQFLFYFSLGLAQHVFDDAFAGLWIIACCVAALPAAILSFADIAFTVCSFLSRS